MQLLYLHWPQSKWRTVSYHSILKEGVVLERVYYAASKRLQALKTRSKLFIKSLLEVIFQFGLAIITHLMPHVVSRARRCGGRTVWFPSLDHFHPRIRVRSRPRMIMKHNDNKYSFFARGSVRATTGARKHAHKITNTNEITDIIILLSVKLATFAPKKWYYSR